jgi:hypothetical protein
LYCFLFEKSDSVLALAMAIEILGRVGRKVGVMDEPASGLFYLQDAKLAFYKNTFPPDS